MSAARRDVPEVRYDLDSDADHERWLAQQDPTGLWFWLDWVHLVRKWSRAGGVPNRLKARTSRTASWGPYGGWRWTTMASRSR